MIQRLNSYAEVELGYTAPQAVAEAQRCLVCGPCSECLACVRACKPGAIVHDQHEQFVELDIGAVIYADDSPRVTEFPHVLGDVRGFAAGGTREPVETQGVYRVPPGSCHDPLLGSAAAARAMFDLFAERTLPTAPIRADLPAAVKARTVAPRVGVFVCQCGDQIAAVVDTETVRERAAMWPDVVHAEALSFSCSPQAAEVIGQAIVTHDLNRVVLAACSCCSIDQVCYSCTYQRVRCKDNLGIFSYAGGSTDNLRKAAFEFVNIREQCAWVHANDPQAATAKATALVAAAVSRARATAPSFNAERKPVERSVVILGSGTAGTACQRALSAQGIAARRFMGLPTQVGRTSGQYSVLGAGQAWPAGALVLAPCDGSEAKQLLAAFGGDGHQPRPLDRWAGLETHRPGVFLCDPVLSAETVGIAVAARVAAWLGQGAATPTAPRIDPTIAAVVDPARCRACATCVEICELGAPQLVGQEPHRVSWIDAAICTGCGTCAAHCPSGAITAGYVADAPPDKHVVIFTCNWNAYSGLESAGAHRLNYPAVTLPIKVLCLGQLHPGLILKAFEKGADGVLLLGCPPGECHYEFGNRHAEEAFAEAKELAALLGYRDEQLRLDWVAAGQGEDLAAKVQAFVAGLDRG
jgi:coenzyme F420-reducing hydrogenase delta subunit/NAD-dependent dihydropyrimidine dehydrogenase PreA subunit